jgi:stage IV sporulation protein FB
MFGSFRLFSVLGVPVKVHGTLLVFLALAGLLFGGAGGVGGVVATVFFLVCIFGLVLLHELGHAVVALHYGIAVREITLYPIGGIAGLATMPRDPRIELHVALAGPLVNFVLAASLAVVNTVAGSALLSALIQANIFLGCFNLLPGFPLDGGRVLRALLARRFSYLKATEIATGVGQTVAVAMGIFALLTFHPILLFIAVFVYFAAKAELARLVLEDRLDRGGAPLFLRGLGDLWSERSWYSRPPAPDQHDRAPRAEPPRRSSRRHARVVEVLPDGTVRTVE